MVLRGAWARFLAGRVTTAAATQARPDALRDRASVTRAAIATNLFWFAFVALWFGAIVRDAATVGVIPSPLYRAEAAIERSLLELDHAVIEVAHDGTDQIHEGFCRIQPEVVVASEELDPELVDGGFFVPPPPPPSCADNEHLPE